MLWISYVCPTNGNGMIMLLDYSQIVNLLDHSDKLALM
jgi:hypothetical protein